MCLGRFREDDLALYGSGGGGLRRLAYSGVDGDGGTLLNRHYLLRRHCDWRWRRDRLVRSG